MCEPRVRVGTFDNYAGCGIVSASISTRSTSYPADLMFEIADWMAASSVSAWRWKSIEKMPLHVPGVPSSHPAAKSSSAMSSVSSRSPLRMSVNSYFVIAFHPSGSTWVGVNAGNDQRRAANLWHGLRDLWALKTRPWHNRCGQLVDNTAVPKYGLAAQLCATASHVPKRTPPPSGYVCWDGLTRGFMLRSLGADRSIIPLNSSVASHDCMRTRPRS